MLKLQEYMSKATSVEHWNMLREEAKSKFPSTLISQLDASGFIHQVLHK